MSLYFQNIECGNIFDYTEEGFEEAIKEAKELYDYGDPTNGVKFNDLYRVIAIDD